MAKQPAWQADFRVLWPRLVNTTGHRTLSQCVANYPHNRWVAIRGLGSTLQLQSLEDEDPASNPIRLGAYINDVTSVSFHPTVPTLACPSQDTCIASNDIQERGVTLDALAANLGGLAYGATKMPSPWSH